MLRIQDSGFGCSDLFEHSLGLLQRKIPNEFLGIVPLLFARILLRAWQHDGMVNPN